MKNTIKICTAFFMIIGLWSCEDEDNFKISEPQGSFNIVTPLTGSSIVLREETPTNPGISLTWSKMDYTTPTEVTYTVELAKFGSDFSKFQELGSTTNTFITIQSSQLNLASLIAGAIPFVESSVDIRIRATSGTTGSQPIYSKTITYLVTAYGCLGQYALGTAIPSAGTNWNSPLNLICNNGILIATTNLVPGTFNFYTTNGDFSSVKNYQSYISEGYKISSTLVNDANNFKFTGTSGDYRLKINTNAKTVTIAKGANSSNSTWLVGAATPGGWSWAGNNETELPLITTGIYEVPVVLNSGEAFRVFLGNNGGDSWDLGSRNYPYYVGEGYTIDSELVNAADGDNNFRYTGPTGLRMFKIDTVTKTITVD
jgi:hypothetical protein